MRALTENEIKHLVDRFLGWRLPEDFNPDGGISFASVGNPGTPHEYKREPSGTNLLGAIQATAMVRYMAEGMGETARQGAEKPYWRPLASTDWPRNTYIYLRGPSGYTGTPYRVIVAKHDKEFRPRQPWVSYSGDSVLDDGEMPTHWMPIIDDEEPLPAYETVIGVSLDMEAQRYGLVRKKYPETDDELRKRIAAKATEKDR